ncbi:MAG: DUF4258 domain-containing protein [Firmicutes bacterium]|nr:DUF4258 domain-containing protein [Bacillota bacterium]
MKRYVKSALIFGVVGENRPIHVVCSMNAENIFIVTAYVPETNKFEPDLKTRKK